MTSSSRSILPENSEYEDATRRFLFTINNQTPYIFVLDGSRKECGRIDAPFQRLHAGSPQQPDELQIRGYKKSFAPYGVTYTVHFRILDAVEKDTKYRLQIFLAVGEIATNNYFGWYIYKGKDDIISPIEWKARLSSSTGYNRNKTDYHDTVLNFGGKYSLHATCDVLKLEIDMTSDNDSHSRPSMVIRPMGS